MAGEGQLQVSVTLQADEKFQAGAYREVSVGTTPTEKLADPAREVLATDSGLGPHHSPDRRDCGRTDSLTAVGDNPPRRTDSPSGLATHGS